jgi:MYXO-CTERM domain-containing protein
MRHRATPFLHVLACAPVAALVAASSALSAHAQSAATPTQAKPDPYVVAIDAGHGGSADNNRPDQPFDPGVVAPNGLQEKDVTLDVAKRLAALLKADSVEVVMTRTDDSYVDIGPRMQAAIDAGAQLFVSIHFNSFTDSSTGGALVLYPNDASLPFAQVMSDAVAKQLQQRYGIADDGVQSKPDLWVHATMPAVTVEGAYMTNPREAHLLEDGAFRDELAQAIRDGIEKQAPQITTLAAQIAQWNATHRPAPHARTTGAAASSFTEDTGGSAGGTLLRWAITLALLAALWRWRRRVVPTVRWTYMQIHDALGDRPTHMGTQARRRARAARGRGREVALTGYGLTLATSWCSDTPLSERLGSVQRRRKSARRRAVLQRAARPAPTRRSVYDELWF